MHCVFVNSLGQSGTHMAAKCVQLLGFEDVGLPTVYSVGTAPRHERADRLPDYDPETQILTGAGWLKAAPLQEYLDRWKLVARPGKMGASHLLPNPAAVKLFEQTGVRMLLIVRHPAGKAAVGFKPELLPHQVLNQLRLRVLGRPPTPEKDGIIRLDELYEWIGKWRDYPFTEVVKFEDLVGPEGGGTTEAQHKAIRLIAAHAGREVTDQDVEHVAANVFGGTATFRSGQHERWRDYEAGFMDPEIRATINAAGAVFGYPPL